jgi:hypothetical protein
MCCGSFSPRGCSRASLVCLGLGQRSQDQRPDALRKAAGLGAPEEVDPCLAADRLAELDALEVAYGAWIVPIDGPVVAEWARLFGAKDKHQRDRALAATAGAHGFVLVTRNIDDVRGCDVQVLDPFIVNPLVQRV